jgi:putative transposase
VIDPTHKLSLTRQAQLLQLSRASLYYEPVAASAADLQLMRRLDELHLQWPFLGSRMLRNTLRLEGIAIGRNPLRR